MKIRVSFPCIFFTKKELMNNLQIFGIGLIFGLLIYYGKMNRYDTIATQSVFAKMNVMNTIIIAIGVGGILIMIEMSMSLASFHVKPFMSVGTLLIFGARLADGCTSGHFLAGGMQFALASYAFMVPTMIGFLVTGKFFYKKK